MTVLNIQHFFKGFKARLRHSPALMVSCCFGLLLVAVSIVLVMQWTQQDKQKYFIRPVSHQVDSIKQALNQSALPLKSIAGLFAASQYVDPSEFAHFTGPMMLSSPAIKLLAWVEKTQDQNDFNAKLSRAKLVIDQMPLKQVFPLKEGEDFYPLMYLHPPNLTVPNFMLGLDMGHHQAWQLAMDKARDSGTILSLIHI